MVESPIAHGLYACPSVLFAHGLLGSDLELLSDSQELKKASR